MSVTSGFALAFVILACRKEPPTEDLAEGDPCRLGDRVYPHLAPMPSPDCNSCICMNGGIVCTLMLCPDGRDEDAGGGRDGGR